MFTTLFAFIGVGWAMLSKIDTGCVVCSLTFGICLSLGLKFFRFIFWLLDFSTIISFCLHKISVWLKESFLPCIERTQKLSSSKTSFGRFSTTPFAFRLPQARSRESALCSHRWSPRPPWASLRSRWYPTRSACLPSAPKRNPLKTKNYCPEKEKQKWRKLWP